MNVRENTIRGLVYETYQAFEQTGCLDKVVSEIDQHVKPAFGRDWSKLDQIQLNFWTLNACLDTYIPKLATELDRHALFLNQEGRKVTDKQKFQAYINKIQAIVKQHFGITIAKQTARVLAEDAWSKMQEGNQFFNSPLRREWYQVMNWFTHPEITIREYLDDKKTQSLKAILQNLEEEDKQKWIRLYIQEVVTRHKQIPLSIQDSIAIIEEQIYKDLGIRINHYTLSQLVDSFHYPSTFS